MTFVHDNGLPFTRAERAADYAKDLRFYTDLSDAEVEHHVAVRYPDQAPALPPNEGRG